MLPNNNVYLASSAETHFQTWKNNKKYLTEIIESSDFCYHTRLKLISGKYIRLTFEHKVQGSFFIGSSTYLALKEIIDGD